jgi:Uma2 family endonuclease
MVARPKNLPFETIAELIDQLGGINPRRIRASPPPGTATEKDLIALHDRTDRLYELVDGTLVEKVMGYPEGSLAAELIKRLGWFIDQHDLGILAGADATMRLMPGLVRLPDLSFVSWDKLPERQVPTDPIPKLAPDLAVEVLSQGNTPKEMKRKLREYFFSGVRLVWFVSPQQRTVEVFTAPDQSHTLTEDQTLNGGEVLPGFTLPLRELFARLPRAERPSSRQRRGGRTPGRGRARGEA